jgi:hypothetical protein
VSLRKPANLADIEINGYDQINEMTYGPEGGVKTKHASPNSRLVQHKNNTVEQKSAFKNLMIKLSPRGTSYNTME